MQEAKVLIAVPYHPAKPYCPPIFMESVSSLIQNTKNASVEAVVRFDPNPVFGAKDNVKKQREWARKLAIDHEFTHLFFHGADMKIPEDTIDKLLAHNWPVVGGVYCRRPKDASVPSAVAWMHGLPTEEKDEILFNTEPRIVNVDGSGLDCILIERRVLEDVSWMEWVVTDDDYPWCDKVGLLGYQVRIDPSIQCRHYETSDSYTRCGTVHSEAG
jgi:hypothetical protein